MTTLVHAILVAALARVNQFYDITWFLSPVPYRLMMSSLLRAAFSEIGVGPLIRAGFPLRTLGPSGG